MSTEEIITKMSPEEFLAFWKLAKETHKGIFELLTAEVERYREALEEIKTDGAGNATWTETKSARIAREALNHEH